MLASAEDQQTAHKRDTAMAAGEPSGQYMSLQSFRAVKDSGMPKENKHISPCPTPCYRQIRGKIFQAGGRITHKDGNMADKQKCHLKKTSRLS